MVSPSRVVLFASVVLFLSAISGSALGAVYVSNSRDWRIPYILGYYTQLHGDIFLPAGSERLARDYVPEYLVTLREGYPPYFKRVIRKDEKIVVVEYEPFVKNLEALIRAKGFTNVRTVRPQSPVDFMFSLPDEMGLDLNYAVLVPQSSGEWVVSAAPLAYNLRAYLILISPQTLERAVAFVRKKGIPSKNVYVVGYTGRYLKRELPDAHFIATGSKVKDSVEIAKTIFDLRPDLDTLYVASGYFLYLFPLHNMSPFWADRGYPVVISYLDEIPPEVLGLMEKNNIKAIVFQGPELLALKDKAKVLFADKGKRVVGLFSIKYVFVEGFDPNADYYPANILLPSAEMNIVVSGARALPDGRLFVTFANVGRASGHFLVTYIGIKCGDDLFEITPNTPVFIDAGDTVTVEYNALEGSDLPAIPVGTCDMNIDYFYGPDADRMEVAAKRQLKLPVQPVDDSSKVKVERIVYSPRLRRFVIYVKNIGDVPTYVTVYLKDVLIDGIPTNLKTGTVLIHPGKTRKLYAKAYLTDADILDNPEVKYTARYGKDSGLPVHITSGSLPLEKETLQDVVLGFVRENPLLVAAALVLIIVLLILLRKR